MNNQEIVLTALLNQKEFIEEKYHIVPSSNGVKIANNYNAINKMNMLSTIELLYLLTNKFSISTFTNEEYFKIIDELVTLLKKDPTNYMHMWDYDNSLILVYYFRRFHLKLYSGDILKVIELTEIALNTIEEFQLIHRVYDDVLEFD